MFIAGLCLTATTLGQAITYTHFVTPNGSADEPLHRTAAVQLDAGRGPGREREHAARQHRARAARRGRHLLAAALTFTGSGAAGRPIKFIGENGVRITGSRVKPAWSAWTLVPGRRYTYQLDWDEVAQFPALPVQRPPVANWRPIWVEDRRPPFTTPSSRRFDLWFPPLYSARALDR